MKAWLITWEWMGEDSAVTDPIACVLPPQWSLQRVGRALQLLYAVNTYTLTELAAFAKRPGRNPYKAEYSGRQITCGHNPFLVARVVSDLEIDVTPRLEVVKWREPDRYRFASGQRVMVARGAVRRVRRLVALAVPRARRDALETSSDEPASSA